METNGLGTNVITQIAIVVRDVEKVARAFAEVLQLPPPRIILTDPAEKAQTRYHGRPSPARAKMAFFQMGPQLALELIEPVGSPSTWQEFLDTHGEGVHHIAFEVPKMGVAVDYLESKGIAIVQKGQFPGGRYAYHPVEKRRFL